MKITIKYAGSWLLSVILFTGTMVSCTGDLDVVPIDPTVATGANVYDDPEAYQQVLAKCYAVLAVSGQGGTDGDDITGIDSGFGQFLRAYWYLQEYPTDEAIIGWNDQTLQDLHGQSWSSQDIFITAMFARIFNGIAIANEYIRETTDEKLDARQTDETLKETVHQFRAEARFLRAYFYSVGLDLFGNLPFVTEADAPGNFFPEQKSRAEIFSYVESELLAIEGSLVPAGENQYGRVDQGAAWFLLARLYLNAEVYIGQPKYTEAISWLNRLISSGSYSLEEHYPYLFLADNNLCTNEILWAIPFDGLNTQTWGGMTYLVLASVGGTMNPADYGINSGWAGNRTTSAFVSKFSDVTGNTDTRALFHTDGQTLEITDVSRFDQGYAIGKWKNVDRNGVGGSHKTYPDTDFPMFRYADAYLMYAEAVLRGGEGGSRADALTYVNRVRHRAYGDDSGNIADAELTLGFILDERARELYWEAGRRTDLVRFGEFSDGDYTWPWKGGVAAGKKVDQHFDLYPIPASDLTSNPGLVQNPGY